MTRIRHEITQSVRPASNINTSDNDVLNAKRILGQLASHFTDAEIKDIVTETRFLTKTWLDDFEREAFDGKTLKELLYERNKP